MSVIQHHALKHFLCLRKASGPLPCVWLARGDIQHQYRRGSRKGRRGHETKEVVTLETKRTDIIYIYIYIYITIDF